ncbi:MAG: hypothetical protein AAGI38_24360, partial [Bacteroidota bacterium]
MTLLSNCTIPPKKEIPKEKELDFGAFKVTVPGSWNPYAMQGVDSYVGGMTDGIDTLSFDYGFYSNDLQTSKSSRQLIAIDTINGKIAFITRPQRPRRGITGIFIEKAGRPNKFNLKGRDIVNEEVA